MGFLTYTKVRASVYLGFIGTYLVVEKMIVLYEMILFTSANQNYSFVSEMEDFKIYARMGKNLLERSFSILVLNHQIKAKHCWLLIIQK